MTMLRAMLVGTCLSTVAATAGAQTVSYSQSTFDPSQWEFSQITQSGGASGTNALSPTGGNGGDAWVHTWSIPQTGIQTGYRVANINTTFTYDPSLYGPLGSLAFSFDAIGIASSGIISAGQPFYGFFVPTLRQNGQTYFSTGVNLSPTTAWSTFSATLTGNSPWVDPNDQASALRPDFSATGGVIEFGYIFSLNTTCGSSVCAAGSVTSRLDNFAVSAYAATVPEPAPLLLLAAGLAGLAITHRRRRMTAVL